MRGGGSGMLGNGLKIGCGKFFVIENCLEVDWKLIGNLKIFGNVYKNSWVFERTLQFLWILYCENHTISLNSDK